MEKLNNYQLPNEITDLVLNNKRSEMIMFESLMKQRRQDADSYFTAFTNLLYMEEAANNVDSNALSLRNVLVEVYNVLEYLCKINIGVSNFL